MCHQRDPTFFRSLSPKDPPFYQLSPNDPVFLTNSLSPKDPDTSLSLKDPSFWHLLVKQVTIFCKKIDFFANFDRFDKMLRNFLAILTLKVPIFWCISLKDPLFWRNLSPKDPYNLRFLVALVRHFHMWVPPPPPGMYLCTVYYQYFILFYFILFYFILFYFILFYFILFYFVLFYFISRYVPLLMWNLITRFQGIIYMSWCCYSSIAVWGT